LFATPGTGGTGGSGGGGAGSVGNASSTAGGTNTGGGGGGTGTSVGTVAAGGSGIVVLKYSSALTATIVGLTSSTVTSGGFKVTTFTAGTGTITFSN
jgi:hypothetical protein